jgi:thiamine biosynthesis protein ThiI
MQPCVLLKLGEIVLRGRNRWRFYQQLNENLRRATRGLGDVRIRQRGGVIVLVADERPEEVFERARDVIGASVVHPAYSVEKTPEAAVAAAIELLRGKPGETFAVRPRRRDKSFPLDSTGLAVLVGREVQAALGLGVDLSRPDLEIHLEVDQHEIFAYTDKLPGRGGLPVGTSGRALVLLSGGIDSPVAAYRMMKRGLRCDFVHFSGRPFTGPESIYKAYAQVARLDRFQYDSRLYVVQIGQAQRELATAGAGRLQVLAQRRLMVRVASEIARRERCDALVTGDALGQVASQTLHNLQVVEAAAGLPILRPLIGWDKSEITREAVDIGTFEISTLPADDCCTLFSSPIAETRANLGKVVQLEGRLDLDGIVERLVQAAEPVLPRVEQPAVALEV